MRISRGRDIAHSTQAPPRPRHLVWLGPALAGLDLLTSLRQARCCRRCNCCQHVVCQLRCSARASRARHCPDFAAAPEADAMLFGLFLQLFAADQRERLPEGGLSHQPPTLLRRPASHRTCRCGWTEPPSRGRRSTDAYSRRTVFGVSSSPGAAISRFKPTVTDRKSVATDYGPVSSTRLSHVQRTRRAKFTTRAATRSDSGRLLCRGRGRRLTRSRVGALAVRALPRRSRDGRDSRGRRIAARVDTAVSDGWVAGGGRGLHCRAGTWRGQAARDASTPNRDRVRRRRSLLHNSLALPSPSVTPLLSNGGN